MVLVASAPLVPLEAPLPQPRRFELLATASVEELADGRWLGGAWTGGEVPGPAFTHDPCSTGTARFKEQPGIIGDQKTGRFTVYVPAFCTAQSIGSDPGPWLERLKLVFAVYESAAVERVLATGDGHSDIGPFLANENLEILNGGDPADPVAAYGLLEEAVARHGTGMLHIGIRTFATWKSLRLVDAQDGFMRTALDTPVVVGYGYTNVRPVDGDAADETTEWAFASGPIEVIRAREIDITPDAYSQAIDRSMNDVFFLAERPYLLNWLGRTSPVDEDHTQAGVLARVDPACCIDGGTP